MVSKKEIEMGSTAGLVDYVAWIHDTKTPVYELMDASLRCDHHLIFRSSVGVRRRHESAATLEIVLAIGRSKT